MCYAKPGPRCSSHTKEAVKKSEKLLKEAQKHGDRYSIGKAKGILSDARYEYYTSPEGLRKLKKKVEVAKQHQDQEAVRVLSGLYEKASADRDGRMAAYQRMVAATERPPVQSVSSRIKSLLGMKESDQPSSQTTDESSDANVTWVRDNTAGTVGYRRSDAPSISAEPHGLMGEWAREVAVEKDLEDIEVSAMMEGTIPLTTEAESRYYYNPELRSSRPSLDGWTPRTESERYAMTEVVGAIVSQRQAAFENAGLSKSAMDTVIERRSVDGEAERMVSVSFGANSDEDSGPIGNYDEGWLYGYHSGVEGVKTFDFVDGDESVQKAELQRFVEAQKSVWKTNHDAVDNDFNGGGLSAWETWYDDM